MICIEYDFTVHKFHKIASFMSKQNLSSLENLDFSPQWNN